ARQLNLPFESFNDPLLRGDLWPNGFERHAITQFPIFCLVNLSHASLADEAQDPVPVGYDLTDIERSGQGTTFGQTWHVVDSGSQVVGRQFVPLWGLAVTGITHLAAPWHCKSTLRRLDSYII